ncbi:MAG: hypothetical protein JNK25_11140 [Phycisphaerae bacterium]|nr:hypothetical protein [Phycisphaerae bacterium]
MRPLPTPAVFATLGSIGLLYAAAVAQPVGLFLTPRDAFLEAVELYSVSADGRTAGGNARSGLTGRQHADFARFVAPGSLRYVHPPGGELSLRGFGMSDDAAVIVGSAQSVGDPFDPLPALTTPAGGLEVFSAREINADAGEFLGVSGDGSTAVGYLRTGSDQTERRFATRWTRATGVQVVPPPRPETLWNHAQAASRDGSMVVGDSVRADWNTEAWVWTAQSGTRLLPPLPFSSFGGAGAHGISPDGQWIVGDSDSSAGPRHPCLWGPDGVLDLGVARSYQSGRAVDVNANGTAAALFLGNPRAGSGDRENAAAIWTETTGTMVLDDYLALHGIAVPRGVRLYSSEAISDDGLTIAGNARYNDAQGVERWIGFVATVPGPGAVAVCAAAGALLNARRRR